ncbi:programmed cell death 1 ligand 1-like [Simochromis diagramma]|uniref:programmed cell death 1 ligand 1-like n=1 Tax=Simochromis diagramma TaxID=43689 RepID=UPI001A7EE87C|nr:programmed cell death 1 ligand 1-like [Simochromis diagramma]
MDAVKIFCWTLGCVCLLLPVTADQKIITAESGQNVTLPSRAPNENKTITVVEWSRTDLESEHVLLYRDEQFEPEEQHPSFKNRVDLQDRQMRDGDVSLILKDVTTADSGTYECRVFMGGKERRKRAHLKTDPISSIYLSVVDPPGQTERRAGLMLSVSLLVAAVIGFLIYKKHKQQSQDSSQPSPAEQCEIEMSQRFSS